MISPGLCGAPREHASWARSGASSDKDSRSNTGAAGAPISISPRRSTHRPFATGHSEHTEPDPTARISFR